VVFVVEPVTDGRDAPNRLPVTQGKKRRQLAGGGEVGRSGQESLDDAARNGRNELREAT
jgi:hypothetical protein